ncbi:hypothetical protein [Actinoplanes awajinensis]|uniref:Uncharacterized protein n=1 Tax=Actinoplanes awajinensis subsp. mycoplanecinus TaxID=135947 RepID=A0A101JPC9_9ACTN|nr:hypothetical protein [Actinoplanes awajinensis]KUL30499.1 hypothetical protein ADL15_24560 [Actinoplanes awajinensis subsp. mycoplanecinus]
MDRTAIDGETPEPARQSPEPTGDELPHRRPADRERIYRRPPATEPAEPTESGMPPGWFGGDAAPDTAPAVSPPEFGPASPGGPGRASFGFSAGPISGNRPLTEPDASGLPIVRKKAGDPTPTSPAAGTWTAPEAAAPQTSRMDTAFGSWEGTTWAGVGSPEPLPPPLPEPAPFAPPTAFSSPAPAAFPQGPVASEAASAYDGPSPSYAGPSALRPPRRQSRLVTVGMTVLGVVAVLVIAMTGVVFYSGPDSTVNQMLNLGGNGNGGSGGPHTVTAPLNGRTAAAFEMLAASDRIKVRVGDTGEDLFRISTPEDSPVRPSPQLTDDSVRLQVTRDGDGADGEVNVVLSLKVRWSLRFSGYAAEREVDLGQGQVEKIEVVGGTRRAVMALSAASGTVPVKITGGVEELTLTAPTGSPIRVKVGGGAGTVTAGSRTLRDVAPGSTLTPKDWDTSGRYDVEAASKITLLSVETS